MNSTTQQGNRQMFLNCSAAIIDAFVKSGMSIQQAQTQVGKAILSQSYLRLEQVLSINNSQITFPVLNNEQGANGQPATPTEQRLTLQDAFYCGSVMMYISKVTSVNSVNMLLNTYPNPVTYPLGAATANGHSLNVLYNGKLSITVNRNQQVLPAMDLMRFNQIPQTQLTAATNSPLDEFDGTEAEFLEPNPVIIGSKGTVIQINMPGSIPTLEAIPVKVVLIFKGLLAQNVTVVS